MNEKSNFNKNVYIIIGILIAVVVVVAVYMAISNNKSEVQKNSETINGIEYVENTEAQKSEIEEGDLPGDSELKAAGLENVMQASKINEQFNLNNYEITENGIKYNYLANAVTNGERLSLTAKAMTEDEYNEMLPKAKMQENTINDLTVVFNDRNLYYTVDGTEPPAYIKKAEEEGNVVVRYGNSLSELLPMQQMMWYADGIGYTLESIARTYTYDDMAQLTKDFLSNAK